MAASAALVLRETPSMKKAVSLINAIDTGRFPRLLTRILQKLHLKMNRKHQNSPAHLMKEKEGTSEETVEASKEEKQALPG